MTTPTPSTPTRAMAVDGACVLSDSKRKRRSVRSSTKHWQPPEGLSPEEVRAVIAAARSERDRLLLRVLWATGARVSEVLALRPKDVRRDSLVLPNRKNPNLTVKRVFLPGAELGLTSELLRPSRAAPTAVIAPPPGERRKSSASRSSPGRGI